MNYKGQLNEYAQKNNYPLPIYNTKMISSVDHKPIFETVLIFNGHEFDINGHGTCKKEAEQECAKKVLGKLGNQTQMYKNDCRQTYNGSYSLPNPTNIQEIIMIDGENLQKSIDRIPYSSHRQIIFYLSRTHHLVESTVPEHVIKRISPSTRSDGCDIYMAMDTVNIPKDFPNVKRIYILTRDKFASAVVDNFILFYPDLKISHDTIWQQEN